MKGNNNSLKIELIRGEQYRPKIEELSKWEDSLFGEVYKKAFINIEEILNIDNTDDNMNTGFQNNIVAFSGERGTGKTSALLSVVKALKARPEEKIKCKISEISKVFDYIDNKKINFEVLEIIDPSFFSKESNILEIILSRLFKKFKNEMEENRDFEIREILEKFNKVYENITSIYSEKKFEENSIENLSKLSAAMDLRENLNKLVSRIFKGKKLIIMIDDIDLHTNYAYEMAEQIRKYLILPNIVILMALKIEQLSEVITKHYYREFQILIEKHEIDRESILNMTEKYIEKLIPQERRVYLPELLTKNLKKIELKLNNTKEEENGNISKSIRKLIYDKTKLLFIEEKDEKNYIVPNNLRELVNFYMFLDSLENPQILEGKMEIYEKNREEFKNYFFHSWCENNLDFDRKKIIQEIYSKKIREKNKYTLQKIANEFFKNKYFKEDINYLFEEENNPLNMSIANIMKALTKMMEMKFDDKDKRFLFAIKTIYSIILYETYIKDLLKIEEREEQRNEVNKEDSNEVEIDESEYSDYEILLGGSLINDFYKSGDLRYQNYKELIECMNSYDDKEINDDINIRKIFKFLYFISYFFKDFRNDATKNKKIKIDDKIEFLNNKMGDCYYSSKPHQNLKTAVFSPYFPLFTALNKEAQYRRVFSRFKNLKKKFENEIREVDKLFSIKKDSEDNSIKLFRNMEVLEKVFMNKKLIRENNKLDEVRKSWKNFLKKIDVFDFQINSEISFENKKLFEYMEEICGDEEINFIKFASTIKNDELGEKVETFNSLKQLFENLLINEGGDLEEKNNESHESDRKKIEIYLQQNKNILSEQNKKKALEIYKKYGPVIGKEWLNFNGRKFYREKETFVELMGRAFGLSREEIYRIDLGKSASIIKNKLYSIISGR